MTRVLVAGVDTATQSTKVRITDAATGEQVRFGQAKHPDGTSVNPEFWWEAFTKAAEQAGGLDDVAALAVGGQQHGMVILDKQGNVIRDAMLWNDTSSAPQAAALIDKLGATPAEGDEPDDVTAKQSKASQMVSFIVAIVFIGLLVAGHDLETWAMVIGLVIGFAVAKIPALHAWALHKWPFFEPKKAAPAPKRVKKVKKK